MGKTTRIIIILAVPIVTVVLVFIFWWYSVTTPEWFTLQNPVGIATIITTVAAPVLVALIAYLNSRARLEVEVMRCVHSVRHSLAEKKPTGTELSLKVLVTSKGKNTTIYGTRIELDSKKYLYRKEDKENGIFNIRKDSTRTYKQRFFITKYEIRDLQLKCIFWLLHSHNKKGKKVKVNSWRR